MGMRIWYLAGCLILLSACAGGSPFATTYGPDGFVDTGGYKEKEVEPGVWQVQGRANAVVRRGFASDIAVLRAAELMQSRGFKTFQIIDQKGSTQGVSIGGGSPSYAGETVKIWVVGLAPSGAPVPCRAGNKLVCKTLDVDIILRGLGPELRSPREESK